MCRRHGVPLDRGLPLLPLLRRAARAAPEVRRNLIEVVDATLAREALEIEHREQMDAQVLRAVATALHRWPAADGAG